MGYKKERERAFRKLGYRVDLENPRSFNEKLIWKKLFDRNPLMPITADKVRVREYVIEVLGQPDGSKILVPLLALAANPEAVPFDNLPHEYVLKANHGSGTNLIVRDTSLTRDEIRHIAGSWLRQRYGRYRHEWVYQSIRPRLLVEALLADSDKRLPDDLKFYMFHGRCHLVTVISRDDSGNKSQTMYTPDWQFIDVARTRYPPGPREHCPENISELISIPRGFLSRLTSTHLVSSLRLQANSFSAS